MIIWTGGAAGWSPGARQQRLPAAAQTTVQPTLNFAASLLATPRPANPTATAAPDRDALRQPYRPVRTRPAEYRAAQDNSLRDVGTRNPETRSRASPPDRLRRRQRARTV